MWFQIAGKRDKEQEQEAQEWIEAVTGERFTQPTFEESLRNGVLLCKLMNKLHPGVIQKINVSGGDYKMMDNISVSLNFLTDYLNFNCQCLNFSAIPKSCNFLRCRWCGSLQRQRLVGLQEHRTCHSDYLCCCPSSKLIFFKQKICRFLVILFRLLFKKIVNLKLEKIWIKFGTKHERPFVFRVKLKSCEFPKFSWPGVDTYKDKII